MPLRLADSVRGSGDAMTTPAVHPGIAAIAVLIGTWRGHGHGEYPTIEPFDYEETLTISHVGKPFLAHAQRTVDASDGRALHAEVGYWRIACPGSVELVVSHPTGVAEVQEGSAASLQAENREGLRLRLRTRAVVCTGSAKEVSAIERDVDVLGDRLDYSLRMAAVGQPLTHHLRAELRRVE